jgi:tetratricopeptide (TPR) repeat protein
MHPDFKINQKQTMTKAVSLSLGFILLAASAATLSAQSSATDMAVNRAVLNQANTIVLRQKLEDARSAVARGDLRTAATLYEDAYTLTQQIGSGIDAEKAQTISGLVSTRLQLARQAQGNGDLREADTEVSRVLKVDPQNPAALAFKKQNDQMIAAMRGRVPDAPTLEQIPVVAKEKTDAGTLVQDGKLLYEMGKLEEADIKFKDALKLDPGNEGAVYYLNLSKQASYARDERVHSYVSGERMVDVEKAWEKPKPDTSLPTPNPYAMTNLIYTGSGRQAIVSKLDRIRLDTVLYDGLPLSEVIRNLSEQIKLRDPDKKGINFLINPNADTSASAVAAATPGAATVDPATGLPMAPAAGAGAAESVDLNSVIIKISPALSDVRLADVLDAIVQVADHPIKYSIEDYAIVFSAKGAETPTLYTRDFRVDPNTFEQGLQSVSAQSFGSANSSGSGSGGSSGGSSSSGSSGGSSGNNNGASVPIVITSPGGSASTSGGGGGGGGGGSGSSSGGLRYVSETNATVGVSVEARQFFFTLGVDLTTPGKSLFFNDRLGELFVRGTEQDLDTIENAIEVLNRVAPQVHIKSRFIEILEQNDTAMGFDWYLGNYVNGNVVANGGSAPSLNVPVSSANPLGTFPGNTTASQIAGSASDQLVSGGLRNPLGAPALTTVTGILTDPNFRVVIHALEQRSGTETLAEPEVVTTSGRQTQMRATTLQTIITSFSFQQGTPATTTGTTTTQ